MARPADPVQAARKAAIKREAKRNRERKELANEARTLRQDTSALERQIQRLESKHSALDDEDQQELKRLQAEVANVKRIKEDYIRNNPDQRNFVRGYEDKPTSRVDPSSRGPGMAASEHASQSSSQATLNQTTPRDPRWSIYHDAVFNPFGAPPPGMPYLEKPYAQLVAEGLLNAARPPPLPEETADFGGSDQGSDSSLDEDLKGIIMPAGPPPVRRVRDHKDSDSHNGRGRHGGKAGASKGRGRDNIRLGCAQRPGSGPNRHQNARFGPGRYCHSDAKSNSAATGLPPRPASVPDPRLHHPPSAAASAPSASASVPATGSPTLPGPPPAVPDGVVVSAEPQLRDLKKEATAFVPAALRRKQQEEKARVKRGLPGRIDAAPFSRDIPSPSASTNMKKPDLLRSVQAHLPPKRTGSEADRQDDSSKNEYHQFLNEVGDLL